MEASLCGVGDGAGGRAAPAGRARRPPPPPGPGPGRWAAVTPSGSVQLLPGPRKGAMLWSGSVRLKEPSPFTASLGSGTASAGEQQHRFY